ncbi:MAG: DUF11 domain-containing protein [Methanobacteriaceae archaeon]|nr:DUF11 domain-containing protein [Methanobacteriaceae archaeon]MDP3624434.1 DUF11 domain-containing protein [Methanobacteriaceae archaeon]
MVDSLSLLFLESVPLPWTLNSINLSKHKGGEKIKKQANKNQSLNKFKIAVPLLLLILSLVFVAGMGAVSAASGDNIYVNASSGSDDNDGLSAVFNGTSGPKLTIKNATGTVNTNGAVNIADGQYSGDNNTNINLGRNMTIIGQSQASTIINGSGINWLFIVNSQTTVTFINLTFTNAISPCGSAVYNDEGNITVRDCTFLDNIADTGGAIYNYEGTALINGCNFTNNKASSDYDYGDFDYGGAAIYNYYGFMDITGSNFNQNDATDSDGAAIHSFAGELNVTGSNFTFNRGGSIINDHRTFSEGPAFFNEGYNLFRYGILNVTNCTFLNNTCKWDGAAIWTDGPCTVTGSVFVNNTAGEYGGAIDNRYYGLIVNFCRFAGNTAEEDGDDIYSNIYNGPPANYKFLEEESLPNIENNWWGSNDPNFDTLLYGIDHPVNWLYMTINATPNVINNGKISLITASFNNLFNGTELVSLDPVIGHVPDGTPVTFNTDLGSIGCKTIQKETINGVATATLTADELAGVAHINAATDNQTVYINVTINPKSSLYLTINPDETNIKLGETVVYTLKVGNKGPDTAKDVVMTYVIPNGLKFAGATVDVGKWTYNKLTRTLTWTIGDVPVGDPVMNISLFVAKSGIYTINPSLRTSTYDPTLGSSVQSLTVNAAEQTINSINEKVPMQDTGVPLNYLLMAVLMILGGFLVPHKK